MSLATDPYRPRAGSAAVLHAVVRDHLEEFLETARLHGDGTGVPAFVETELRRFLTCGVLAHGFTRVRCDGCGFERLVPFACKGRGFCPSCGGRRMAERAAHLTDRVLPAAPLRQWVLTVPHRLLPADVDTLAPYGDGDPTLVSLHDRLGRLALLAFPHGERMASFFGRTEHLRSRETASGWELEVRGRRRRTHDLQATLATLARPFEPCGVEWNGRPLAVGAWTWDEGARVLRATFTGRRGRLVVRSCDG